MRLIIVAPKKILFPLIACVSKTHSFYEIIPIIRRKNKKNSADPYAISAIIKKRPRKTDGLLLIIPRHSSVLQAIPSSVMHGVPIGLLLADTAEDIMAWCNAIDIYFCRHLRTKSYLSLAMNTVYFKSQAQLLAKNIRRAYHQKIFTKNLFADMLVRDDLLKQLAQGPSLVTYIGHSSLQGWEGYRNIYWKHIAVVPFMYPCGVVMSISCDTVADTRIKAPFGVSYIAEGRACAYVGAAGKVKMNSYSEFVRAVGSVIVMRRPHTIGELMAAMHEYTNMTTQGTIKTDWSLYRLIGNPLQLFC